MTPTTPGGASVGAEQGAARPLIQVACGVLVNAQGRVLSAQRPGGKIAAGYWEFPGGKIEPGETALMALTRELHEELGVTVREARPLIRFHHAYSNRDVILDTWLVTAFDGEPHSCEGQALAWLAPADLAGQQQALPTVAPIARALNLPVDYVFTPPQADPASIQAGLRRLPPKVLLRLRLPGLPDADYERVARELLPECRALDLRLILDREPQQVVVLGADGWHATTRTLATLSQRPLPDELLCLASAHSREELLRAQRLGFDAAVLGPVLPTASHPGAATLGWGGFSGVIDELPLPVYAIGGLGPADAEAAFRAYAQGVAGISAYW